MVVLLTGILLFGMGRSAATVNSYLYGIQPLSIWDSECDFFKEPYDNYHKYIFSQLLCPIHFHIV